MGWIVIMTWDQTSFGVRVRSFGPYDSEEAAEQGRRRVHFMHRDQHVYHQMRTFVSQVEVSR